jgi:hypothetical protein
MRSTWRPRKELERQSRQLAELLSLLIALHKIATVERASQVRKRHPSSRFHVATESAFW